VNFYAVYEKKTMRWILRGWNLHCVCCNEESYYWTVPYTVADITKQ